jgi:hypothetical protein
MRDMLTNVIEAYYFLKFTIVNLNLLNLYGTISNLIQHFLRAFYIVCFRNLLGQIKQEYLDVSDQIASKSKH